MQQEQQEGADEQREAMEEEEDEDPETFIGADRLLEYGVNASEVAKLTKVISVACAPLTAASSTASRRPA